MEASEIIRLLCKENHISVTDLESRLGFGNGSLTKGTILRSDRLLIVAQFFGVSMEYLMGQTSKKDYSSVVGITPEEAEYLDLLKTATPEAREFVYSVLKRSMQVSGQQD